jgi:hypothetical protein
VRDGDAVGSGSEHGVSGGVHVSVVLRSIYQP